MIQNIIPFLLIFLVCVISQQIYEPQQIHLAIGWTPDRMGINWMTFDNPSVTSSVVWYSKDAELNNYSVQGGGVYLFYDPWRHSQINRTIHLVFLRGLDASTIYYYKCGDSIHGWSNIYSFKTGVNSITLTHELPIKYIIFGDLGVYELSNTVDNIIQETNDNNFDTLIHVGDFAYDMYQEDGTRGDYFMNMIQPIASRVPYMTCPGNHEKYENFTHYSHRFRGMPTFTNVWTGSGETPNNWYYSWNEGYVHWIAISTEIYFNFPWMIKDQYEWLLNDLIEANNNRTNAPWIIIYGHKQIYCSDPYNNRPGGSAETLRDGVEDSNGNRIYGLEDLFYEYGVDFYIAGHQHNYERIYDVYKHHTTQTTSNMPATTYILTGAAGAKHGLNDFESLNHRWSAVKLLAYGYSRFYVYNETHIQLQQLISDPQLQQRMNSSGNVYETVWYVQQNHGPFGINYPNPNYTHTYNNATTNANNGDIINLYNEYNIEFNTVPNLDDTINIPYISDNKYDYAGFVHVDF